MLISGKKLSMRVIEKIKKKLEKLSAHKITPKIAIVTAGPDTSWKVYVRRKIKLAEELNIQKVLINLTKQNEDKIVDVVRQLNDDKTIHGIIVQRPLPSNININAVINSINPEKDIDGFREDSMFIAPIWLAVEHILKEIYKTENNKHNLRHAEFSSASRQSSVYNHRILNQVQDDKRVNGFKEWFSTKKIVVIGKGETGGQPIIDNLRKLNIQPMVIDSKTQNKEKIINNTDIIISAVGSNGVVEAENLKIGVVLIGIGLHRGEDGKLHGDYDEEKVRNIASYYTPTPGGVGPLNLSFLFKNLVEAAKINS